MKGIIGTICGDIIGSTREFNSIKTKDFELLAVNIQMQVTAECSASG